MVLEISPGHWISSRDICCIKSIILQKLHSGLLMQWWACCLLRMKFVVVSLLLGKIHCHNDMSAVIFLCFNHCFYCTLQILQFFLDYVQPAIMTLMCPFLNIFFLAYIYLTFHYYVLFHVLENQTSEPFSVRRARQRFLWFAYHISWDLQQLFISGQF